VIRNFEGFNGNQHEYRVDVAKATLKMCQAVGAPLLIVCSTTADLAEESSGRIEEDLRKLANLAVPLGVRIGYKAVPWGRFTKTNIEAWNRVAAVEHANFDLVLDSFHFLANQTAADSIKDIDPDKIALVQLADFSALEISTPQDQRDTSIRMRVFPGDGVHNAQLSEILRQLDRIGYRGDYSFLVFNEDYQQLPHYLVIEHAKRSIKWVTDQVLRRSLPLRSLRERG
jgi:sugar phosphate isomerase/epimerase